MSKYDRTADSLAPSSIVQANRLVALLGNLEIILERASAVSICGISKAEAAPIRNLFLVISTPKI
jgi:hypothetical protein